MFEIRELLVYLSANEQLSKMISALATVGTSFCRFSFCCKTFAIILVD